MQTVHATLFPAYRSVYDPFTHQDYERSMKDHDSFANKPWEGFGGQVKEDKSRIWPEPEWGEEVREGEQMSDILIRKKNLVHDPKNDFRYRCCFALQLIQPGDSIKSQSMNY